MGFKNNSAVKLSISNIVADMKPREGFMVYRDKEAGTATVDIWDKTITFQKAGSLVQGMYAVPVKFVRSEMIGNTGRMERRHYVAQYSH